MTWFHVMYSYLVHPTVPGIIRVETFFKYLCLLKLLDLKIVTKCGYTTIIHEPCHTPVFIIYWVFINRIWEMTSLHVKCLCKKTDALVVNVKQDLGCCNSDK